MRALYALLSLWLCACVSAEAGGPLSSSPGSATAAAAGVAAYWDHTANTPTADTFDAFSDSSINAIWREYDVNVGLSASEDADSLTLTKAQDANSFSGYTEELPLGADMAITACMGHRHGVGDNGDAACGLMIGEDCSGAAATCGFYFIGVISGADSYRLSRLRYTKHDTFSQATNEMAPAPLDTDYCVRWWWDESDTDVLPLASSNGRNWHVLGVAEAIAEPVTAIVEGGPLTLNTQALDLDCDYTVYRVDLTSNPKLEIGELN